MGQVINWFGAVARCAEKSACATRAVLYAIASTPMGMYAHTVPQMGIARAHGALHNPICALPGHPLHTLARMVCWESPQHRAQHLCAFAHDACGTRRTGMLACLPMYYKISAPHRCAKTYMYVAKYKKYTVRRRATNNHSSRA